jgi:hypothetical protein
MLKPEFLTAAPVRPVARATGPNYPVRGLEPGLTLTPLQVQLTDGLPVSGKITRRMALLSPVVTTLVATGTTPPVVTVTVGLDTIFTLVVDIVSVAAPTAITWTYNYNGAGAVAGTPFDEAAGIAFTIPGTTHVITFPIGTYAADNAYTSATTPGTIQFRGPVAEKSSSRPLLMRSTNEDIAFTVDAANGKYTAAVNTTSDGLLTGYLAQRRNALMEVTDNFQNGTLPAVTRASLDRSLQARAAAKPAWAVVEDLAVDAVTFTTDGSGNVVNPGTAYQGSLSAYITRTDTGVYSLSFARTFPVGTVFLAVRSTATGSASAVIGASNNVVTVSTFIADAATNVVSGTVVLFIFCPMSKVGADNQNSFNTTVIPGGSFVDRGDFHVVSGIEQPILIPFQFELNGGGDIIAGDNTIIPDGVKIYRSTTTFTVELGICRTAIGFATSDGVPAAYPLVLTNLQSQGRLSFTATLTSTIVRGIILAAGAP